jgi:hypothetical protein
MRYLLVALMGLFAATFSQAADPQLEITFTMDAEAALFVKEYPLYIEKTPGVNTLLGTLVNTDPTNMVWVDTFYDIPMGKTLNYYMGSVDVDGDAGLLSPPYPFKLTGKAVIIKIRRVK